MPPMVARLDVDTSTGNHKPIDLSWRFSSSSTMPGSTVQVRGCSIGLDEPVQVFAVVDDQRAAHGLAGLRGAAAARQQRHALLAGDLGGDAHVLGCPRHHHADRLDLVDRGIGRIASTAEGVEQDLALDFPRQPGSQVMVGGVGLGRGMHRKKSSTADYSGDPKRIGLDGVSVFDVLNVPEAVAPQGSRRRHAAGGRSDVVPDHQPPRRRAGRHFLQIPGPTPVPDRILRAMDMPVIDHRGPEFQKLGHRVLEGIKTIFKTKGPVIIYPASGTGAWEAALSNALSPGDKVLMYETGHFATLWKNMAQKLGLEAEFIASDWRSGADAAAIEARLREDKAHAIKAVCVVHNETSTGATSRIDEVRRAIDAATHPALLMVDTISSLGSVDYRHDEWNVDITVGGSQKGLMLPPGLSFNAISDKALAASKAAQGRKRFGRGRK